MILEIVIASGKGGVGKSTVSSTLALYLANRGYNVIAVDADADAPNLHLIFNMNKWDYEEDYADAWVAEINYSKCEPCGVCEEVCPFNAVRFIEGRYVINTLICEGCLTCSLACPKKAIMRRREIRGKVRVGKTPYGFPLISAELSVGRPNSGKLVTEVKNKAKELASRDAIIIVDSAAGIGCQVISSLAGANAAILVAEPTPASFSDLRRVHMLAKHFMLPSALIINKYDINMEVTEKILRYANEENMDVLGFIPYDDSVPKSMALMGPLIALYPDSPASKALLKIARLVEERIIRSWDEWFTKHKPEKPTPYKPIIIKPAISSGGG